MSNFKEYDNPWNSENSEWYGEAYIEWSGEGKLSNLDSETCDNKKTNRLKLKYKKMIANARKVDFDVAADNLQHFLNGTGTTRVLNASWLRSFDTVVKAESRILNRAFHSNLSNDWINEVKENEVLIKTDYWDADIVNYNPLSELSYASGASDMIGNVYMNLIRTNNQINIKGHVKINWTDDYDWHNGLGFKIPRVGYVDDADAIYLQDCGGARAFHMTSGWHFDFIGSYNILESQWEKNVWMLEGEIYIPEENTV